MTYGEIENRREIFDFLKKYDIIEESIVLLGLDIDDIVNMFDFDHYNLKVNTYVLQMYINNNKIDAEMVSSLVYTKVYYQLKNLLTSATKYDFTELMKTQTGTNRVTTEVHDARTDTGTSTRQGTDIDMLTTFDSPEFVNDRKSDKLDTDMQENKYNFDSSHVTNKEHVLSSSNSISKIWEIREYFRKNLINTILFDGLKNVILSKIY